MVQTESTAWAFTLSWSISALEHKPQHLKLVCDDILKWCPFETEEQAHSPLERAVCPLEKRGLPPNRVGAFIIKKINLKKIVVFAPVKRADCHLEKRSLSLWTQRIATCRLSPWKEQFVTSKNSHLEKSNLSPWKEQFVHLEKSSLSPWKEQFVTLDTADCHVPKWSFPPWKEDCHLEKAGFVALKRGGCPLQMGCSPTDRPIRDTIKHCPCFLALFNGHRLFAGSTGKVQGLLWTVLPGHRHTIFFLNFKRP